MSSISKRDLNAVWHPFTPQQDMPEPLAIVRGEGTLLFDENNNAYIDAIASWWVNIHGHAHPYIAEKVSEQLRTLEHAIFSGYTHRPAVELAERLKNLLPWMDRVFYSDDGSTSVEVALKMAFQYWHNSGNPRTKVIAFENAYHGDTFGSMSVGARNVFSNAFEPLLFEVIRIPVPVFGKENESVAALKEALSDEVAAFIFEPLVQGAAGMIMYESIFLDELLGLCQQYDVITIADEVMTGFGRTGRMFASDYLACKPDIVCLSKGLTGGFLPLGATLCIEPIYAAYLTDDRTKTFFHGHSYTANPLACTAANASLDLFETENTLSKIEFIADYFRAQADRFSEHPAVKEVRYRAGIFAIEIRTKEEANYLNPLADRVPQFFQERGIILRPLGNVIYVLPPYCITKEELEKVFGALEEFLEQL